MLKNSKLIGCLLGLALFFVQPTFAQDLKNAIFLTESEQFEDAHKAFDALIAKEPNNGNNYYYYGQFWLKQFFVDSMTVSLKDVAAPALKVFNKGIEVDPTNPLNFVGAGRIDVLLSKYDDAKVNFDKAIALLPWKNFSKSTVSLKDQALTFAKIAEAKLRDANVKQAELLEYITKAVERADNVPEVYLIKGDIYLNTNDGSNAILAYNKANDLDPKSCKAMVKIGQLWVRGKSYTDALVYYKDALEIDSSFAPAYRERAELYILAGQWENGIKDLEKFMELSKNNNYAKIGYAKALFMAKKYEDALSVIKEVLSIDQSFNVLNRLAAYAYFETGKYTEGLESIGTFFKNSPPEKIIASDYAYYGKLYAKSGNDSLAIEKFQKAFELDPENYDILSEKAKSQTKLKDYVGAAQTYDVKIKADKASLNDIYELGKVYFNLKDWEKADTTFGLVLAKKPDFINALKYRASSNVNIDTTSEKGLAKKYYEALIDIYMSDSVKYEKDLYTAFDYLRYFYFKQYNLTKNCEDAKNARIYCEKALLIDPKDEKSIAINKSLGIKCKD